MPSNQSSSRRNPPSLTDHFPHLYSLSGSHEIGPSDSTEWHNHSSHHTTSNNAIDIDVPYYWKESDLWNTEKPYLYTQRQVAPPVLITAHSSSVDDYQSVIDDLTLEIQQLKKEIKLYKQPGPAMLHKDKLFEIKVHGLSQKKQRELETTLRNFATDLDSHAEVSSSQKRRKISSLNRDHTYSKSGVQRKHAPSSLGSNLQPADSTYASMSAGAESSRTPSNLSILTSIKASKDTIEGYLRDVPDGLYPQRVIMTDKERKNLVVRRLEKLFTGRSNGADISKTPPIRPGGSFILARAVLDAQVADPSSIHEATTHGTKPIREAIILSLEQKFCPWGDQCHLSDSGSASDLDKDTMKTECDDSGLASDSKPSSPTLSLSKQRPTRPCDLDPDRAQIPSENLNYIQHLDLLPPALLSRRQNNQDTHLEAAGWVSLNLLYNLAQLHLINVTLDLVRSAVLESSTKFQLSPDGHKIRWRGRSKDTKLSSYSSGYDSQEISFADDIDSPKKKQEHAKTSCFTSNESKFGGSSKDALNFDPQFCAQVESFHYKPLFAQRGASVCSSIAVDHDNPSGSGLGLNYSRGSATKWQHHDGAITYYSGAPFCTDLSGDPADLSPNPRTSLGARSRNDSEQPSECYRSPRQKASRVSIDYKPLKDRCQGICQQTSVMDGDSNKIQGPMYDDREQSIEIKLDLIWNNDQQYIRQQPLEPSGLGGVRPDDHFTILVDTKRPKHDILPRPCEPHVGKSDKSTESVIRHWVATVRSGPVVGGSEIKAIEESRPIEIEYLSWRTKRLLPAPLPFPASFFSPFSNDNSTSGEDDNPFIDGYNAGPPPENMGEWIIPRYYSSYPNNFDVCIGVDIDEVPDELY
ncbi:frequency clock protein [Fusarium oxysporum]|nr:frequency clock protein [Fusarium oxysporum]